MSRAVVLLPGEQETVRIASLQTGETEFRLYESPDKVRAVKINLVPGENRLELSPALIGGYRSGRSADTRVASRQPLVAFPLRPQPATADEAALMVRLAAGTEVYLDGGYYGSTSPFHLSSGQSASAPSGTTPA